MRKLSCGAWARVLTLALGVGCSSPRAEFVPCDSGACAAQCTNLTTGSPCANGSAVCISGTCTAGCEISNVFYRPGDRSPGSACQTCQPEVSISSFSPATGLAPGGSCGNGSYCYQGQCSGGCSIAGTSYAPGDPDPQSSCLGCVPTVSATSWSNLDPGTPCGTGGACSGGVCLYGCEIGGVLYPPDTHDPAQVCQSCQPAVNPNGWSPLTGLPANTCVGGQVCLDGSCAAGCYIKRAFYRPGDRKPDDVAQCCGPSDDAASWSPIFVAGPTLIPDPQYSGPYWPTYGAPQLAAADFNRDGRSDLAFLTNHYASTIALYLSQPAGGLAAPVFLSLATGTSLVAGDLNGDGYPDLAASDADENVYILMNLGDGGFGNAVGYPANLVGTDAGPDPSGLPSVYAPFFLPGNLTLADVNHDGILDLVVSGGTYRGVSVLIGIGDGRFQPGRAVQPGTYSSYLVETADFNGDGVPDILVLGDQDLSAIENGSIAYIQTYNQGLFLLLNDGQGNFGPPLAVEELLDGLLTAAAADFDGDGKADIAAVVSPAGAVALQVFRGIGDGGFKTPDLYRSSYADTEPVVADFNGDTHPDLLLDPLAVLQNQGDGTFALPSTLGFPGTSADYFTSAVAGDFNGDGLEDLAVDNGSGVLMIWLNNCH